MWRPNATPHELHAAYRRLARAYVLVAGFGSNQVEAMDTRLNTILWKTAVAQPHTLGITPDGRTAYAASQRAGQLGLMIIDVASGAPRGLIPLNHAPRALTVSPDGEEVYFTEAGVDAVLVLDRATNAIVTRIPVGASPHYPLFTADGKVGMVVAQRPGELDLFDPYSHKKTGDVKFGAMPHWIAATSDNQCANRLLRAAPGARRRRLHRSALARRPISGGKWREPAGATADAGRLVALLSLGEPAGGGAYSRDDLAFLTMLADEAAAAARIAQLLARARTDAQDRRHRPGGNVNGCGGVSSPTSS